LGRLESREFEPMHFHHQLEPEETVSPVNEASRSQMTKKTEPNILDPVPESKTTAKTLPTALQHREMIHEKFAKLPTSSGVLDIQYQD